MVWKNDVGNVLLGIPTTARKKFKIPDLLPLNKKLRKKPRIAASKRGLGSGYKEWGTASEDSQLRASRVICADAPLRIWLAVRSTSTQPPTQREKPTAEQRQPPGEPRPASQDLAIPGDPRRLHGQTSPALRPKPADRTETQATRPEWARGGPP